MFTLDKTTVVGLAAAMTAGTGAKVTSPPRRLNPTNSWAFTLTPKLGTSRFQDKLRTALAGGNYGDLTLQDLEITIGKVNPHKLGKGANNLYYCILHFDNEDASGEGVTCELNYTPTTGVCSLSVSL